MDTDKLHAALAEKVDGEVRFDAGSRAAYAHDGSNYRQPPLGVVVPRSPDTAILADGFSCRTQLAAGRTVRDGLHLAQLLARITPESDPGPRRRG